ncbi:MULTISPECIES: hypothetical protein [unclassified Streptomyces]|uniref:hypothetical protein n=1 Tax=unclassified Streptomyces TaxID=2593676 RepID=UPI002E816527|nr:hypothetical protein [Streptomyces sp. NBC_00589]WTI39600.1 hypothetical protein OIC96_33855 [Streptomyces sp. NBC_00775]WUB26721.1 hypothetical protein OHA51_15875 [Streptomyces sp. NBC_00589]
MKRQIIQRTAAAVTLTACLAGITTTAHAESSTATAAVGTRAAGGDWEDQLNKVVHVRSAGSKCGKKAIAEASGDGHMTLRIDETKSVSTTLSKNISATYKAITVAVGWDVTKSRSITVSGSKEVPRGKHGVLKAYTRYSGKKFDVQRPAAAGIPAKTLQKNKVAYKPIGVCFKYQQK